MWLTSSELEKTIASQLRFPPEVMNYPDNWLLTTNLPKGLRPTVGTTLQWEASMYIPGWKWGTWWLMNVSILLRHSHRLEDWTGIWKSESVLKWGLSQSPDKTETSCEIWKRTQISPISTWTLRSVWCVTSTSSPHESLVCASLYFLLCAILLMHISSTSRK